MNKTREAGKANKTIAKKEQSKGDAAPATTIVDAPPLKPRPGLFVGMAVVLVLLLAGLLTLYFKTVYPIRNLPHAIETDKTDEPGAGH